MHRVIVSILLTWGLSIIPGAAHAKLSLLFPSRDRAYYALGAFKTLCLEHRLDRAGTLKAADAQGWLTLPDREKPSVGGVDDVIKGVSMTVVSARWKQSEDGDMVLLLGDGGSAGEGCAIAFHSNFRMASAVMGGSEMQPLRRFEAISPKYDLWMFVEDGGRRRAVKGGGEKIDHSLIANASAERRLATIAVIGSDADEATLYLYSVPPPQKMPQPVDKPSAFIPDPQFDRSSCQAARDAWVEKYGPSPSHRVGLPGDLPIHRFLRFDMDCDQKLTLDEHREMNWYSLRSETGVDGEISYAEFMEQWCGGRTPSHINAEVARRQCERIFRPNFRRAKAPGRNVITKESYARVFAADFRKADRNRDGFLTINKDRRRYFYD